MNIGSNGRFDKEEIVSFENIMKKVNIDDLLKNEEEEEEDKETTKFKRICLLCLKNI